MSSTALLGVAQAVNILVGLLRNKAVSLLIGASGVGLASLYYSVAEMVRSMSGLGIEMSGTKEIAVVSQQNDVQRTANLVTHIRRLIRFTACLSALVCLLFSHPISLWVFDSEAYQIEVMCVAIVVMFSALQQGQMIVLQGMGKVAELAKITTWGNVIAFLLSLPLLYFLRTNGILLSLVVGTIVQYLLSNFYYRSTRVYLFDNKVSVAWSETWQIAKRLFRLGGYLVLGTALGTVTMLAIRSFLVERAGMDAAGLFQAVWAVTNVCLMLVLRGMGGDFYPRLCGIIHQRVAGQRLIREQTHVALLLITPLAVAVLLLSPVILLSLYSSDFLHATDLLRWQVLGAFLKVASYPMAFILLAKGRGREYLLGEFLFFALYYGGTQCFFPYLGLSAVGVGYVISYVVYWVLMWMWARKLIRFRFDKILQHEVSLSVVFVTSAFLLSTCKQGQLLYIGGTLLMLVVAGRTFLQLRRMW